MITLDGVIYVHQNPKRRRRRVVAPAEAAAPVGAYAEPSVAWGVEAGAGEPVVEWGSESGDESAVEAEVAAVAEHAAEAGPDWRPSEGDEPVTAADPAGNTRTIVRTTPMAPPPGYAVEFGTGRLVRVHSFKGRMSYPTGNWE